MRKEGKLCDALSDAITSWRETHKPIMPALFLRLMDIGLINAFYL